MDRGSPAAAASSIQLDRGGEVVGDPADPALGVAGLDPRGVDLGDDPRAAGDLQRLGLGAGHPAEPRGDKGVAGEVAVLGHAEIEPAGVEQGDVGAVDDALGADVHPAAGGHLTVVDAAQGGEAVEVLGGVEHPDHETVGDDGSRRFGARGEEPHGVARTDHEGLGVVHDLEIALDEQVLHPVLTDLAGLTIGDELVRIERDIEIEVVLDHHLHGLGLGDLAGVAIDGATREAAVRAVAVAVDPAAGAQFFEELGCDHRVVLRGHIAQGVGERDLGFAAVEGAAAIGGAADSRLERSGLGKLGQLDGESFCHGYLLRDRHSNPSDSGFARVVLSNGLVSATTMNFHSL